MAFGGYGGFAGGMMDAEQSIAATQGQQMANVETALKIQAERTALQIQAQTRAAMQAEAARQLAASAGGPKDANDPSNGADFSSGGATPGGANGMASGGASPKSLSAVHYGEYQSQLGFARAAAAGGDVNSFEKFKKNADDALAKATAARNEERKESKERWTDLLQWATGSYDQKSLNDTIAIAKAKHPEENITAFMDGMGFQRDPANPNQFLWNDNAAQAVKSLREKSLTELDRVKRAEFQQEEARRQQSAETLDAMRTENADTKRIMATIAQGNLDLRREMTQQQRERQAQQDKEKATKSVQASLDKDPVYNNWTKFSNAFDLSQDVIKQLQSPQGFQNFNPSDARALATAYRNISEGFRGRVGGKYEMQDMSNFNGALQKVNKWVESFGRGTPTFDASTAKDVSNSITQLYNIANKNTLISSLEAQETALKRGGDPSAIKIKGNLQDAVNAGMAWKMKEGDKEFLVIGRKGSKNVARFEISPTEE